MFDTWVREVRIRHGIGAAADALAACLLPIVFDERQGGIAGLISRFHHRIGGDTVPDWIGNGTAAATTAAIVEDVIGRDVLAAIDEAFELAAGTTSNIAAAELPALIGRFTPERRLPIRMPAPVAAWLALHERAKPPSPQRRVGAARQLPWMKWGLVLGVAAAVGYFATQGFGSANAKLGRLPASSASTMQHPAEDPRTVLHPHGKPAPTRAR